MKLHSLKNYCVRNSSMLGVLVLVMGIWGGGLLHAHEMRPGYLEIKQTDAEVFDVLWKVPAMGELRLSIHARMPDNCKDLRLPSTYYLGSAFVDHRSLRCAGGLTGRTVSIEGLAATVTDVLVRIEYLDGTTQVELLAPKSPAFVVAAQDSWLGIAVTYVRLGLAHILLGFDHLLFVLALILLVEGRRRLIGTVTAFTVAHSLTLIVVTLSAFTIPQQPVEAVIALSIMFIAGEIIHKHQGRSGLMQHSPYLVAFSFGLLHGLGFAGALSEVGLPQQAIPLALLFFNVGVELGQLLFIAVTLFLFSLAQRFRVCLPTWAWRVPPYGIGVVAGFWTISRIIGL